MSKKIFKKEEIEILSSNKCIKHVSAKGIIYTDEFKRIFITESGNNERKLEQGIKFVVNEVNDLCLDQENAEKYVVCRKEIYMDHLTFRLMRIIL